MTEQSIVLTNKQTKRSSALFYCQYPKLHKINRRILSDLSRAECAFFCFTGNFRSYETRNAPQESHCVGMEDSCFAAPTQAENPAEQDSV